MTIAKEWHTNVMEILDAHAQLVIREMPTTGEEETKPLLVASIRSLTPDGIKDNTHRIMRGN